MLRAQLGRGCKPQELRLRVAGGRMDRQDPGFAEGQRPGLVEHDRVDPAERLQMLSALYDGTIARRAPNAPQHRQRRAGRHAAGAGDDDHRDRVADVSGEQVGEDRRGEGEVDEITGELVGEALDRSAGLLGVLDRVDDAPEAGVAPDAIDLDVERAGLVDRAGEDDIALAALDRHRLAGDARLIDIGCTRHHDPIDGNVLAGRDEDPIADADRFDRDDRNHAVAANGRAMRHHVDEVRDRSPATIDRQMLQLLGDEHEEGDDQRGEELRDRGCSHDGDRHGQFHGHPPLFDVVECLAEDRPGSEQQTRYPDDVPAGDRADELEPDQRRRDRDGHDAQDLDGFDVMTVEGQRARHAISEPTRQVSGAFRRPRRTGAVERAEAGAGLRVGRTERRRPGCGHHGGTSPIKRMLEVSAITSLEVF